MALAKLGDEKERNQILMDANTGDDPALQELAVRKLAYVGGSDAIRTLVGLLGMDKPRNPKGYDPKLDRPVEERPLDRVVFVPLNLRAMEALAQIVSNPPVDPKAKPTQADVPLWRKWYEMHKDDLR